MPKIHSQSDEAIVKNIQSGETDSFGLLIERYEGKIKRYGLKFLNNQDDLEDVLQTVFLKAFENIKSFDAKRRFSPWLYRIAHNEFVNHLKKRKFLPLFEFDSFLPAFGIKNERESKENELDRKKEQAKIDQCLTSLTAKQKEPLILYYYQNLSYQEIAEIMQVPVSTVGVRIKRAKEKVRQICKI